MLIDAGGDGEDIRVENDVLRQKPDFLREQVVGASQISPFLANVSAWPVSSNAITITAAP